MKHLAIFSGNIAEDIFSGKKTIDSRFSKAKIAPFGKVSAGDTVFVKPSGEEITGQFRVKKVIFFDGLTPKDIEDIKNRFGKAISVDDDYWKKRMDAKYATLIFIDSSNKFITSPFKVNKQDLRGWMVL